MKEEHARVIDVVFACLATAATIAGLAYLFAQPYFEYRAYNKATGASKGYWDAVIFELKVPSREVHP